jgi:hypothetical protein
VSGQLFQESTGAVQFVVHQVIGTVQRFAQDDGLAKYVSGHDVITVREQQVAEYDQRSQFERRGLKLGHKITQGGFGGFAVTAVGLHQRLAEPQLTIHISIIDSAAVRQWWRRPPPRGCGGPASIRTAMQRRIFRARCRVHEAARTGGSVRRRLGEVTR